MTLRFLGPLGPELDDEECIRAEGAIAAYLDGTAESSEQAWLFEHMMACDLCLQAFLECTSEHESVPLRRTLPTRRCSQRGRRALLKQTEDRLDTESRSARRPVRHVAH